jgi:metal-sulfur cluster biosynthetic enzyme
MSLTETLRRWFVGRHDVRRLPGRAGRVVNALGLIPDPELGVGLVDLGLIRGVEVDGSHAIVRMTVTKPDCPQKDQIVQAVAEAVHKLGLEPEIHLELDPPWTTAEVAPATLAALAKRGFNGTT